MKNSHLLYKFRKIDKFAIDILVNKKLYLSSWTALNDPHEAVMYIEDDNYNIHANPRQLQHLDKRYLHKNFIDEDIMNPKICSLATTWSSNLLWSHYTAGHSGIAIGITLPTLPENMTKITIKYDSKVPVIKQSPLNKNDILAALTHKSEEWQYEREIRLVSFGSDKKYIEGIEIKEINFGLKASNDDMKLIFNLLKNEDIKFFKTGFKSGTYQLNKSDIQYSQL